MVEEPYIEALKKDYIGCGGRMPYKMIEHLRTKIGKGTNKDKVQLKKEVFIMWKQPQGLNGTSIKSKTKANGMSRQMMGHGV